METEEQRLERMRREELDAPIDAEWCKANGGSCDSDGVVWSWDVGNGVRVEWNRYTGVSLNEWHYSVGLLAIQARGQLLGLLRLVKGGAT